MSRKDTPIELADDCSTSIESRQFQPGGFLDNQLRSLGRGRKEPINDTIEGELSESKEFVEVLVGPDQEIDTFPLQSLWNRHYFRDPKQGLLLIDYNKRGMWELKHPSLFDIKPDDFVFVAEYLESDDFGHRNPQDGEEMTEAFAQCVAAWVTAEKLGMSDMMDHTVEKLERLEPEMLEILVFCRHVYARETTSISHEYLKGHLAVYIADNFWEYIKDDHLRSSFIELLQHFPELQQDVYERRILALKECVDQSQEDSDTDMD
ncbi:hypothetical protein J4E90_000727 [Alternaria incomplexa]|uniref:uncharacterized protein n=1 Tax=Alternaria incomplexa TaxID=1187928 RepID=UPI00221E3E0D|nr:uncharacterized protein J4E90_000727 [Alternaria incomplexa]KAI4922298.1 hypothetical protein J4E90_000727 [Alternaria incomplexa]